MKKMLIASIGKDVHIAGIYNFMKIASNEGYEVTNLGSAVDLDSLIGEITKTEFDLVAISYRLGKESCRNLLNELKENLKSKGLLKLTYIFGGTVETGHIAEEFDFIDKVFDGSETEEEIKQYLRKTDSKEKKHKKPPQNLVERIDWKKPDPLIRHHIGLSTIEKTYENIKKLANSELLDIVSLAPDQNCQEYFFEQDKMNPSEDGAGGVPIRSEKDLEKLFEATRRGNYPLMRCYSGTNNLIEFGKILKNTINNAWGAIPLTWYSALDRRSEKELLEGIKEKQKAIEWHGKNSIPVEVNESHQWALRYAHDAVEVATAYLTAYNAKKLGVNDFIQQLMLCTPPTISPKMDLAKMMAKKELLNELENEDFRIYYMIRNGLLSLPADPDKARSQMCNTIMYGLYLNPDIVHVAAYCESIERATADEIIESVKMIKRTIRIFNQGMPNINQDKEIIKRKKEIINDARLILDAISELGENYTDPLTEPEVIFDAVKSGILDAPGLKGFSVARGEVNVVTRKGANSPADKNGNILSESERLESLDIYR